MGAVVMLPLSVAALAAVEFHHVTSVRSRMQAAIDASTLAAAKSGKKTPPDLKSVGSPVFLDNLAGLGDATRLRPEDLTFNRANGVISGKARLCIRKIVSSLVSRAETCVHVNAEVVREATVLEVVLVLDNSGSMGASMGGQTRIAALETAARGFIAKLQEMDDPDIADDVRIGIVPFAGAVKIDPANASRWWIDRDGRSALNTNLFHSWAALTTSGNSAVVNPKRFEYFSALGVPWAGCVESRHGDFALSDAPPNAADPNSLFVPYFAPDDMDWNTGLPGGHAPPPVHYPNDYIEDRVDALPINPPEQGALYRDHWEKVIYGHEKYVATNPIRTSAYQQARAPSINVQSQVAGNNMGPNRWCQTRAVTPLNADFPAMSTALTNTPLARHTNIPHALVWGWHVLSPNAPFANGKPYTERGVRKVLVLMTDGDNLMDPPAGSGGEDRAADSFVNRNESYYGVYG